MQKGSINPCVAIDPFSSDKQKQIRRFDAERSPQDHGPAASITFKKMPVPRSILRQPGHALLLDGLAINASDQPLKMRLRHCSEESASFEVTIATPTWI